MSDEMVIDNESTPPVEGAQTEQQPVNILGESPNAVAASEFLNSLPEDMRTDPNMTKFNSTEALGKSYLAAQSELGRLHSQKTQTQITAQSTPDEIAAYHKANGRPDEANGYTYQKDTNIAEDVNATFDALAHNAGLNDVQAKALYDGYVADIQKQEALGQQEQRLNAEQVKANLIGHYGMTLDAKLALADNVVLKYGGAELQQYLNSSGLTQNEGFIKMLVNFGEQIQNDVILSPQSGSNGLTMNSNSIQDKITELQSSPNYLSDTKIQDEVLELYAQQERLNGLR